MLNFDREEFISSGRRSPHSTAGIAVATIAVGVLVLTGCTAAAQDVVNEESTMPVEQIVVGTDDRNDGSEGAEARVLSPTEPNSNESEPDQEPEARRYDLRLALGYTAEEDTIIRTAWQFVFDECIMEAGYESLGLPSQDPAETPDDLLERQRFRDLERISTEGYHYLYDSSALTSGPDNSGAEVESPKAVLPESLEIDCKTRANERVASGNAARTADQLLDEGQQRIEEGVMASPEMLQAAADWGTCMQQSGYDYGTIFEAVADMSRFGSASEITEEELRMAVADANCRQSSQVFEVRLRLVAGLIDQWIGENAAAVAEMRNSIDSEVDAARAVLSE